ncbi:MAG: FtsX-like permease family protein, partial [Terriglobales bacterium]
HLLTLSITLPDASYPDAAAIGRLQQALLERLRALPGVAAAALASELPLEGGNNGYVTLPGAATADKTLVEWTRISPSYFAATQIPLLAGRAYSNDDQRRWENSPPAVALPAVVNQAFVRHFFPGQTPIGKQFRQDGGLRTIVGVAANTAVEALGPEQPPQLYVPASNNDSAFHLLLRSSLPQAALLQSVRGALASLDPTLPIYNIRSMDQVVDDSIAGAALQEWLVTGFASLALILAAAGIYGVMSYLVAARTREIGVRMALGATRAAVLRLVIGRGLGLALAGIALGTVAALAAGQLLASQLYQVPARDPATMAAAALVLLAASLLACYLPARRAASVDPNTALRVN